MTTGFVARDSEVTLEMEEGEYMEVKHVVKQKVLAGVDDKTLTAGPGQFNFQWDK